MFSATRAAALTDKLVETVTGPETTVTEVEPIASRVATPVLWSGAMKCFVMPRGTAALDGMTEIDVRPTSEPLPARLTICGLLIASSRTANIPPRNPLARGVNVTLMVQLPPGAKLAPQSLV